MFDQKILGEITSGQIFGLFAWVLGFMLIGKLFQIILVKASKTKQIESRSLIPVILQATARPMMSVFFVIGLKQGLTLFEIAEKHAGLFADLFDVLMTIVITYFIFCLIAILDHLITRFTSRTKTTMDDMMAPMVRKSLRIVVVILGLVQIAQTLSDKPITSILTGLGVGGLAVALAAQETIKNFFGSLVIFADKPFDLGERVVVNGHDGTVEEVGFRSSRIRTLDGHLVTIPNGELANMSIQNIAKRPYIKRTMNIAITYNTPPEKVKQALSILNELLADHEGMKDDFPPRILFSGFNECSLNILVIYWYHPPLYWDYMAHAEYINLQILERFNEAGIEFAFPTQTIHLASQE